MKIKEEWNKAKFVTKKVFNQSFLNVTIINDDNNIQLFNLFCKEIV